MTLTQNELYALILAAVLIVALIAVIAWARRSGDARNPYACNSASDPSMCVW